MREVECWIGIMLLMQMHAPQYWGNYAEAVVCFLPGRMGLKQVMPVFRRALQTCQGCQPTGKAGISHLSALARGVDLWNCDVVEEHKINKEEKFGRFLIVTCSQTTLWFALCSVQFQPVSRSSSGTGGGKWQQISQGWTVVHPQELVFPLGPPWGILVFFQTVKRRAGVAVAGWFSRMLWD